MNFFIRNKKLSDPEIIISSCFKSLLNRITDDFDREGYNWDKPWGVKRFESIVLAKYILDYSFEKITKNKLSDEEKNGYYALSDTLFSNMFNEEFSEVGMNFECMQEEIERKVQAYSTVQREHHLSPECYNQFYMIITGSQSRQELEEEAKKKTAGLAFIHTNENFTEMIPHYENQINQLKKKIAGFDLAEIILPHMFRFSHQKLKKIKLKKIISLSKKLAKKEKNK